MFYAYPFQKFQDWFTQQWVIFRGTKIDPTDYKWLMGPFGNLNGIGEEFIQQLATKENLTIQKHTKSQGLIPSIDSLNLSESDQSKLSKRVRDFYENTADYNLYLNVKWNPVFKVFGILINKLFSSRINQLNLPLENDKNAKPVKSDIITLSDINSGEIKYTIWLRTSDDGRQVMYSGIYGTCKLPSSITCVKAVFPLPQGNATVIMIPYIGESGDLILESSGKKIGDAGFYFQLKDSKGNYWTQFISSFRDHLIIRPNEEHLIAEQTLTLWKMTVLKMNYKIEIKK